ncbi:ISXO2-like transposase domain [Popillia japonica]|uniref:ISXO2-like transposase domain n=1 Tax=Popillia japonica TaxID=7064 RepID=A0AAW1LPI6_POPJA
MSFMYLVRITDKIDELPQQLHRWDLIPTEGDYKCPTCGNSLRLEKFQDRPTKLGGPGIGSRKYHKGHRIEGQWVFGGFKRSTGRVFMVPVEQRGTDTLLPIIKQWIKPGTTIISDCWKAYDVLHQEGDDQIRQCLARLDTACPDQTRSSLVRPGWG